MSSPFTDGRQFRSSIVLLAEGYVPSIPQHCRSNAAGLRAAHDQWPLPLKGHSGTVNMRAEYVLNEQSTCPTWHTALEIDNTTM